MKLIFMYGLPAAGKLTVAQELAALTGYKLFHNHLTVDLLLSVFEFGTAPFVQLREEIWLSVFEQACRSQLPGVIFTFAPEPTVRPEFLDRTSALMRDWGGEIDFVELVCPLAELKARIDSPSRRQYRKLISLALFEQLHAQGEFEGSAMPQPRLTLDTSRCAPAEAALRIAEALGLSHSIQVRPASCAPSPPCA